ncbi:HSP90 family protein [Leucobacter sp. OH1287]|uniref:HSP90 family protein n=1 Tax=Leucobacter sp. OH1287 TaxID=2491049 RepID=UPI0018F6C9D9|nr:HSP90 family protein [Leucobacter sp. OH1287]
MTTETELTAAGRERFQVDLSGMIDLLSKHLYSGPQVYIRELLQNGVDAITARRALEPDCAAQVRLSVDESGELPVLTMFDTGIGLTADEARSLLATIGRSSKKDADLGVGRAEYLGQFGIGLLSAFLVADKIEVWSKSVKGGPAIHWVGESEGTFAVSELSDSEIPEGIKDGGTMVRLGGRYDSSQWVSFQTVKRLTEEYGSMLPLEVLLETPVGENDKIWSRVTVPALPWKQEYPDQQTRKRALSQHCEKVFGITPLDVIDLSVPALGITGAAFVLPQAVAPGSGQHHVYLKQMLLGARIENILPDWAFFVRAIIDTDSLHPTASREQLHEDQSLLIARETMGEQLKAWITSTLSEYNSLSRNFVQAHNLALRAAAVTDTALLELVAKTMPYETTLGLLTLEEARKDGQLLYATTVEAYRRISNVARVAGICVVNAGYAYDTELIQKLALKPDWSARELQVEDITKVLETPSAERELATAAAISDARQLLADSDSDVLLRNFEPATLPAVVLLDPDKLHKERLNEQLEQEDDMWSGLLESISLDGTTRSRTLVLNDQSSVIRQLLSSPSAELFNAGLIAVFLSAVSQSGEYLHEHEAEALGSSLELLMQAAFTNEKYQS